MPPYYLEKSYVKPFGKYRERRLPGVNSSREALAELSEQHITGVLDVRTENNSFPLTPNHAKNLTVVFEGKDQRIYHVSSRSQ